MAFFGLFRRKPHERAGYELYTQAVRAARDPYFYAGLDVPDTMDGRFDMVGLFVFLLIHRLQPAPKPGAELAQAVFDAMFNDMDMTLRELGVSDMRVGKRVKAMWEAFHGRAAAYAAPLDAGDAGALAGAIGRNVWRDDDAHPGAPALAAMMLRQRTALDGQSLAALVAGQVAFAPSEPLPA